ncbi:neprilysin-4-like [Dermacentor silvarum]|uniref:neprilysin-4-like n=1 Tax=Dermacentor silvarum TaxID=543639 RepID=UPI002100ED51|nr:neprilysin-4-like [Dermacentor silvarum]
METDTLNVHNTYYDKLNNFIATANPNTLYNYAGFLTIYQYLQYVNMSTEDAISYEVTQSTTRSRNWRECIALIDESARDILDYLYVTNDPNHVTIKNEVETIARRMKEAFNETLQNNGWIDNTTRDVLQKKLKEVPLQIGYPDALLNMSVLETRYQYVPFFPWNISFTEALYHIQENSYKMQLRKLQYPFEGDLGWDHSPRDGRTFHHKWGMKIEIPYELLVPPFFDQGLPRSLNYGGIGGTIANELAYSFLMATNSLIAFILHDAACHHYDLTASINRQNILPLLQA